MSKLIDLVKERIPEGPFKDKLRDGYHLTKYMMVRVKRGDCTLGYSITQKQFEFTCRKNVLKGISIKFPKTSFQWLSAMHVDLPSYFCLGRIPKDSMVIDIGAFPGDYTVAAAKMVGNGSVIALEPDPDNRLYLEDVIALNNMEDKVEVLPYALSNEDGSALLYQNGQGSRIINGKPLPDKPTVEVETRTLDSILKEKKLFKHPNLIVKMDIEGAELKACDGAKKAIKHGTQFAIAAYHKINGQKTVIPLSDLFSKQGYSISYSNNGHLVLFAQPQK